MNFYVCILEKKIFEQIYKINYKRIEKLYYIFNGYLEVIKKSLEWKVMKKYGIYMNNFDK